MASTTINEMIDRLETEVGELDPATRTATVLVCAAHQTRDRGVWGGDRAITYWDRLPDRVRTACYRGPTTAHWWEAISRALGCGHPSLREDREAVATALAGDSTAVLSKLRSTTETVCLLVRLAVQYQRAAYTVPATADQLTMETAEAST